MADTTNTSTMADILQAQQQPITGDNIVSIQNSLLDAMKKQREAADRAAKQANRLSLQQINASNAASGTLFSTRPSFQGAQQVSGTYLPTVTKNATTFGDSTVSTRNTVANALKTIQAYNDAAAQLNSAPVTSDNSNNTASTDATIPETAPTEDTTPNKIF